MIHPLRAKRVFDTTNVPLSVIMLYGIVIPSDTNRPKHSNDRCFRRLVQLFV
jgi:hypothetical protein